jgi:hypothetical protein
MEKSNTELEQTKKDILENIRKKYPVGNRRLQHIKGGIALTTVIGTALAFYSSIFHLPGQMYSNTDNEVLRASNMEPLLNAQSELLEKVDEKIVNSVFEPIFVYENGSIYRGGTGFAIEELEEVDKNFRCITTLVQSHGELNSHKVANINIRLPNSDKDILAFTYINKNYPYKKAIYGSGWDFVALCFENESIEQTSSMTFVGQETFGEYTPTSQEKVISIGLPSILENQQVPSLFLSEHVAYTPDLVVGGEVAQGESGGIILSEQKNKIVGTIVTGPNLKNTVQIQSISNLPEFLSMYDNLKQEALKLWTGK